MTISNTASASGHYVLGACEAWGHTRPFCTVAARIAKSRSNVIVSLFTSCPLLERVENEVSRNFTKDQTEARARVRVIAIVSNEKELFDVKMIAKSFIEAYNLQLQGEPVTCAKTGKQIPTDIKPTVAIYDIFSYEMAFMAQKLDQHNVKVICWVPAPAAAVYHLFGPGGGFGSDTRAMVEAEMKRSGRDLAAVASEILCGVQHKVIEIPGIPLMYDYEHYPQQMMISGETVGPHHLGAIDLLTSCDGCLISSSALFEPPEAIDAVKRWFGERKSKAYVMGPMTAEGPGAFPAEEEQSPQAVQINTFMQRIYQSHGPQSMIYISFGSIFWSAEPEKIWTFLDVIMAKKLPFIMSHASPFAQIPEAVSEKVKAYGLGLMTPWSPQQTILSNPVTGWFVTHCGWNSVVESLTSGVPLICWPFQADQAMNTVHMTDNMNVAYELTEVRTGHGLKPIYRTGKVPIATLAAIREETERVLNLALGKDGVQKRANAHLIRDKAKTLWKEGGASYAELHSFLDDTLTV